MATEDDTSTPIFVRLPNWVGDVCMTLPCLEALAQTGHRLVICARPWARDLIGALAPEDFVPMSGAFGQDRRALAALPRDLRRRARGLIMPDSLSSAALFFLAGIRSAGYRDDGRSLLLRWSRPKPTHPVHAAQKWWLLTRMALNQWGIDTTAWPEAPPSAQLALNPSDYEMAQAHLTRYALDGQALVLLAPTATGLHRGQVKVWPHFEQLAQALKQAGYQPVICPPANEQAQAVRACPSALLLDPLPIRGFCALAKLCALVVCNDSGVSHLASAVGAEQITLFGVTDPATTRPWSDRARLLGSLGQWPSLDQVNELARQTLRGSASP